MSVVTTSDGDIYTHGSANLLDYHEFFDIDVTKTVLSLIDQNEYWMKIMRRAIDNVGNETFYLLIGEELERDLLEPCSFIYQSYKSGDRQGMIGVMGPSRLRYTEVIPLVGYVAGLISSLGNL